jgi:hypothetical protein
MVLKEVRSRNLEPNENKKRYQAGWGPAVLMEGGSSAMPAPTTNEG